MSREKENISFHHLPLIAAMRSIRSQRWPSRLPNTPVNIRHYYYIGAPYLLDSGQRLSLQHAYCLQRKYQTIATRRLRFSLSLTRH